MEEIQRTLMQLAEIYLDISRRDRETDPEESFHIFLISERVRKAAEELERMKPVKAEYEGDAKSSWWYVCEDCHTAIDPADKFCRQCGRPIQWA